MLDAAIVDGGTATTGCDDAKDTRSATVLFAGGSDKAEKIGLFVPFVFGFFVPRGCCVGGGDDADVPDTDDKLRFALFPFEGDDDPSWSCGTFAVTGCAITPYGLTPGPAASCTPPPPPPPVAVVSCVRCVGAIAVADDPNAVCAAVIIICVADGDGA